MLPDSSLKSIPACNGTFTFDDSKSGRIKLRIRSNELAPSDWEDKPSSSSTWTYPQWVYDFSDEEWLDSNNDTNYNDNNDTNNNGNNFYVTASPNDPAEDEYTDVTVKARDGSSTDTSYRGVARFKVERKSGSSWVSASSSYYTLARTSYTFTSSDRGIHTFSNLVKFRDDSYDYRLVVYDDDDSDIIGYKYFYLNGTDNNNDNSTYDADNFYLTASPSDPNENEYVDISVRARDGSSTDTSYRGTARFKVERKSGSSWVSASSSYYTLARTSYTFTSSDRGAHDFTNLVKFRDDSYNYRLVVYDDDDSDIIGYKYFYFDGTDNDNITTDSFTVTASPSDPAENEYVDITVQAKDGSTIDDNYVGIVRFKVERKSGSSRVAASSSYYTLARTSYTFTSSDDGEHDFANLVKFRDDSYDYRLVVYDDTDSDIVGYKYFYLDGGNNTDNADNFYVSTDDSTPAANQRVDLRLTSRNGTSTDTTYDGDFVVKVYYRTNTSSWIETTSTSYFEINSTYDDDYQDGIRFSSSWNGTHTFYDFIRFKRDYQYKVVVEDVDDSEIDGYQTFDVIGSIYDDDNNDTSDNFYITTDDTEPSLSQRVDLTVRSRDGSSINSSYNGDILMKVYYRTSDSSSWIQTTSSSYFAITSSYASTYDDGIRFSSSWYGEHTFYDFIQFKKNYQFKVVVEDTDDSDVNGYKTFDVGSYNGGNSYSSVDGFTTSELSTVQSMYNAWPAMITNLKAQSSKLRNSTTWKNRSDTFYDDMADIINDVSNRTYDTYDEYYAAFLSWYNYTLSIK